MPIPLSQCHPILIAPKTDDDEERSFGLGDGLLVVDSCVDHSRQCEADEFGAEMQYFQHAFGVEGERLRRNVFKYLLIVEHDIDLRIGVLCNLKLN